MSSSTSSSEHRKFLLWVALAVVATNALVALVPWGGVADSKRSHQRIAREVGAGADFLIAGDSKANPFSVGCLSPWLSPYRGVVFSADSVTPIFHYENLVEIRKAEPGFAPRVVFLFVGANNFNTNGQHVQREYTFFNELDLGQVWEWSGAKGQPLFFVEALLSRLVPLYGKRVMITHLQLHHADDGCAASAGPDGYEQARNQPVPHATRNAVDDKNYYDIYRRSVYGSYESAPMVGEAVARIVELVRAYGGLPVIVLPPVTPEIRQLEHQLIGEAFDQTLAAIVAREHARVLDLRGETRFEFRDVNHLSPRGARDLAVEYFLPIVEERLSATRAADARSQS